MPTTTTTNTQEHCVFFGYKKVYMSNAINKTLPELIFVSCFDRCKLSTYSSNWWVVTLRFCNDKPACAAQLVNNKLTGSQEEKYLVG